MAEPYRTLSDVAAELQVPPRWLRDFVRAKKLPVLRSGRIVRFDALALRALEEAMRCRSASHAAANPPATAPGRLSPDERLSRRLDELLAPRERSRRQKVSFVYFIGADDETVKIGVSDAPRDRLRELQIGTSAELRLLGTLPGNRETEQRLHRRFSRHRVRGEWFRRCAAIDRFIAGIAR